jgi:transcription initiation factor IIE alpha subunit
MISIDELKRAIMKEGLDEKEARGIAEHIMNFFGYEDRIIDNYFDNEDRSILYFLQDKGLVSSRSEEVYLGNGKKTWRIFYWILNTKKIKNLK